MISTEWTWPRTLIRLIGGQNKNLGPAGSLAFQFPEMIVKVSKGISAIISSILIPTNAFQRDGIAARFIDNSKNTVSEVTTESNPSASSKPDANMANLVSVTDGSANTSTATKVKFLALYFAANLGLTLYNKYIMLKVRSQSPQHSPSLTEHSIHRPIC